MDHTSYNSVIALTLLNEFLSKRDLKYDLSSSMESAASASLTFLTSILPLLKGVTSTPFLQDIVTALRRLG